MAALREKGVELRADEAAAAISGEGIVPATEEDWTTEYLELILAVKVVDDLDAAIAHINEFGSHHSDCIVTADQAAADQFMAEVDSAVVFWNTLDALQRW